MDNIDERVLNLIENLLESREQFFSHDTLRLVEWSSRGQVMNRFMINEFMLSELINRVYVNNIQARNAATALITLATQPLGNTTFFDSVPVVPTQRQISSSLQDSPNVSGTCAICQDAISSGGCTIRQCGHSYHRECIENWFSSSVRCPVCRYDIRQAGQSNQTSSASSQTSARQATQ